MQLSKLNHVLTRGLALLCAVSLSYCRGVTHKSEEAADAAHSSHLTAITTRDGETEPFDIGAISDAPVALMATRKNLTIREPYLPILQKGQMIKSPGEDFVLRFQMDGSLVVLARGKGDYKKAVWRLSFRASGSLPAANVLFLSQDAELVAYHGKLSIQTNSAGSRYLVDSPAKTISWSTESSHLSKSRLWSCHGSALTLSDDGELLVTCGRFFNGDVTPHVMWTNQRGLISSQVNSVVPSSVAALFDYQVWSVLD